MAEKKKTTTRKTETKTASKRKGVVELRPNDAVEVLEKLLGLAKEGHLDNFVFAGFNDEDLIVYSRVNLNVVEQQHLVSYLQCDTVLRTVNEGYTLDLDDAYQGKKDPPDDDGDGDDDK